MAKTSKKRGALLALLISLGFAQVLFFQNCAKDLPPLDGGVSDFSSMGGFVVDDFEDGVFNGWTAFHHGTASLGTPFFIFDGGLHFDCAGGWTMLKQNPLAVYTNYVLYTEQTLTSPSTTGGALYVASIGRVQAANNHYLALVNPSGGLRIHRYSAATPGYTLLSSLDAVTVVPRLGVTYATKLQFLGSEISFKVWEKGAPEPVDWQIRAVDGTIPSGGPGFACHSVRGIVDFIGMISL